MGWHWVATPAIGSANTPEHHSRGGTAIAIRAFLGFQAVSLLDEEMRGRAVACTVQGLDISEAPVLFISAYMVVGRGTDAAIWNFGEYCR